MAKRRRASKRRTVRAAPRRAAFTTKKKRSRRKGTSTSGDMALLLGSAIYGGGRAWASDKLAPLTAKVPAGQYADELVLGALGYLMMKKKIPYLKKIGISKDVGRAALIVEAARTGEGLSRGLPMLGGNNVPKTSTPKAFNGF